MSRFRVGGAILLALALLIAACGDDADSAADSTTPLAATTGDGGSEATNAPGDDGGDFGDLPSALSSNDCFATATALGSAFSGGFSPDGTFDPDGIADAFDRVSQLAPSEIRDDVAVMADGLGLFFSVLKDNNIDLGDPASLAAPGVAEALENASNTLESTAFEEASDNVNAWFESMCSGINS